MQGERTCPGEQLALSLRKTASSKHSQAFELVLSSERRHLEPQVLHHPAWPISFAIVNSHYYF